MSDNPGAQPQRPRLFGDLQLALATLYSLPLSSGAPRIATNQAHDYLMNIQSRNVRRRIQAIQQSHRDQSNGNQQQGPRHHMQQQHNASKLEMGSSWLACLFLLVSAQTATEQLFCAQTMLHRLRRNRILEAIDWEAEHPHDYSDDQVLQIFQSVDVSLLSEHYKSAMRVMHPLVGAVLESAESAATASLDEERIKGEMTLLTLVSLLYLFLCHDASLKDANADDGAWQKLPPIATTLGAAIAMTALRLCYTVMPPQHEQQSTTILSTIMNALSMVWNSAIRFSDNASGHNLGNQRAFVVAGHACLGSIPDTVMGGMQTSGVRGRLSMDPKSLQAAMMELRQTGVPQLWEALKQLDAASGRQMELGEMLVLDTCANWARFLPLTTNFLHFLCPLINKYLSDSPDRHQQLALALVMAIMEGGNWTVEDVLAHSLGLSEQQQIQQLGKKKQSNKSKKRHTAMVQSNTSDMLIDQANAEVHERGDAACYLALLVWDRLRLLSNRQMQDMTLHAELHVDGEGPIGCSIAAANACLPHVVRNTNVPHGQELFAMIVAPFQEFCRSSNKSVRALVMEALYSLHKSVGAIGSVDGNFEASIVDHFYLSAMGVATACCYPSDYFGDLGAASDEDLEIERNDVRDLVRAVSGSAGDVLASPCPSAAVSTKVLVRLVLSCKDAVESAHANQCLCPESAVHTFSALAKSLNQSLAWMQMETSPQAMRLSLAALETILLICSNVLDSFDRSDTLLTIFPVCRTANIAVASLSPFLAGLCVPVDEDDRRPGLVREIITVAVKMTAYSIKLLPELTARSSLGRHLYDIRGAMRGPGGEDHVGCLALMRLVNETETLTEVVVKSAGDLIPRLCQLHIELQKIETERGQGIWHGKGVTPKSRRILLSVLCRLEIMSEGVTASTLLGDLFHAAVDTIAAYKHALLDDRILYEICEAVHDIVAFPSALLRSLFDEQNRASKGSRCDCLDTVTRSCLEGYRSIVIDGSPDATCYQWNRLRAATFYLLTGTGAGDIPATAAYMLNALVHAECEAICQQCSAGRNRNSNLFCEEIMSDDVVPAGIFVFAFSEIFRHRSPATKTHRINSAARTLSAVLEQGSETGTPTFSNTLEAMYACKGTVLAAVLLDCPEPDSGAFVDPRPTMLEAWLLAMVDLMQLDLSSAMVSHVKSLLAETFATTITLLFYPSLKRSEDRSDDPGMSFDGPHSLAIMDFLSCCLALPFAMEILEAAADTLSNRMSLDFGVLASDASASTKSIAVIAAAFFRAAQGGLPPWAVESIPEVYSSFYGALGRDVAAFGMVLRLGMDIRLPKDGLFRFGGLQPGKLLSGRYFESLSSESKDKFVRDAMELACKDDVASWRRLKVLIKSACGGKKKDSGFQLKPSLTRWDFDRV